MCEFVHHMKHQQGLETAVTTTGEETVSAAEEAQSLQSHRNFETKTLCVEKLCMKKDIPIVVILAGIAAKKT